MGAHTPACLRAASDPVETVTPPLSPIDEDLSLGFRLHPFGWTGCSVGCKPGQPARV